MCRLIGSLPSKNPIFSLAVLLFVVGSVNASISRVFWHQNNDNQAPPSLTKSADCANLSWLSARQKDLCRQHPSAVRAVLQGMKNAASVCRQQFKNDRWNCSSHEGVGSREAAYIAAISSGSAIHAIAKSCAKGRIDDCGCAGKKRRNSDFTSSGCSDNVRYGDAFVRKFIEAEEKQELDSRNMMNLHNSRAARRILAGSLKKRSKCHGVSGSCTTKTSWKVVPTIEEFATFLKEKYDRAQQVVVSSSGSKLVIPDRNRTSEGGRAERYLRADVEAKAPITNLVFLDASPNYCADHSTEGRECTDADCGALCCGRGFIEKREMRALQCRCKYAWINGSSEIRCDTCLTVVERRFCR